MLIIQSLWKHIIKNYRHHSVRKLFLNFISYYCVGWLEMNKINIIQHLKLTKCYKKHLLSLKPQLISSIKMWSVYKKFLRNNNSLESNNMWDRYKLGFHPTINKFVLEYLYLFEETIKQYDYHQWLPKLPNIQENKYLIQKKNLIKSIEDQTMTYNEFLSFAQTMIICKFAAKHQDYDEFTNIKCIMSENV